MRFGTCYGGGWGSPDKHLAFCRIQELRGGLAVGVSFRPATGFGNAWFSIYQNARFVKAVYVAEDMTANIILRSSRADQSIAVLRSGAMQYDCVNAARTFEGTASGSLLSWSWPSEYLGIFDEDNDAAPAWISSLSLSGITWAVCNPSSIDTRGEIALSIAIDGSTATVEAYNNNGVLASGSGSFPGTITLAESEASGISGSVYIDTGAVDGSIITAIYRWPKSMLIKRGGTTIASVPFNSADSADYSDLALASGTYSYVLQAISDTGMAGTASSPISVVISLPPQPPEDLVYSEGDAAETILAFSPSATTGATYRAYLQQPGAETIDMDNVAATAIAGSEEITLPAITGYPGTARVILRAVKSGIEDGNTVQLALDYDASGNYLPLKPNSADIKDISLSNGLTANVTASYLSDGSPVVATSIKLFSREPDGTYDLNSPDDSAAISNGLAVLEATYTAGWRYFMVMASTAGGVLSANRSEEVKMYLSDAGNVIPFASGIISRG